MVKEFKLGPITDPAEIAALERRCRAALAEREAESRKPTPRKRKRRVG